MCREKMMPASEKRPKNAVSCFCLAAIFLSSNSTSQRDNLHFKKTAGAIISYLNPPNSLPLVKNIAIWA
jgi:hypothetical protein